MKKTFKIGLMVVALVLIGGAGIFAYLGGFSSVTPEEREIGPYHVVYKEFMGPYSGVGPTMQDVATMLMGKGIESTQGIGLYYGDPKTTPAEDLRSEVGFVLTEDQVLQLGMMDPEYGLMTVEKMNVMMAEFPLKNKLSYFVGPMKAYPAINTYRMEHNYGEMGYAMELYDLQKGMMSFMMEISK
ncbi:MAG: hypothetical protein UT55_C0072G0004 [Candidatus Peregrinibacteria bacterium GW2011_GWE2_39_6]|nr:MAG: hypothetical protein UT36_C0006G0077 [Candidatus Peregrinibacteria bacterium GW2011_GWF2_39_17]KKR24106.1 MAG: hypothetical protein UT55_C0072G0004 [Candidatus Peregrinibacteria bacterium GW2011_GWE2_39_6]HCW32762.1 hypothetical protein [Candidatus Peregrinibacteria bacterium]